MFADRPATVCGERTHTFARTADRVARLAGGMRALGVGEGDRVAYLGLNSDRFLEYYLATWWAGAVVNPVNVRWAAAEIGFSLEDSATTVLVVDDAFAPMIPELRRYGDADVADPDLVEAGERLEPAEGVPTAGLLLTAAAAPTRSP